jgi:hypothetical protein
MNDPRNQQEVSKVEISALPVKKNYKIWLNTNNTASYSGPQFDATFPVELNKIIQDPWRLKSSYRMTFSFLSRSPAQADMAATGLSTQHIFTVHIDLGKGTPTMYQYNAIRIPAGVVHVKNEGVGYYTNIASGSAFNIPAYFSATPNDNDPVFINDLLGVSKININLIESGVGTFNAANDAGINASLKYVVCLNLQEL